MRNVRWPAVVALLAVLAAPVAMTGQSPASGVTVTSPDDWLGEANYLRSFWSSPVPTLTEDPALSANIAAHVHYLGVTRTTGHTEDPTNPNYTAAGQYGGTHSVLYRGRVGADAVDGWIATPLHGEQVVNPRLTVTGFASTSLDGGRAGMDTLTNRLGGPAPTTPMTFPSGVGYPITSFAGNERDSTGGDAIANGCPTDYASHQNELGAPLFAILPGEAAHAVPASPGDVWLKNAGGTSLPFCLWNAASPSKPSMSTAILLPRHRLAFGQSYTASYTAGGYTATWDFAIRKGVPRFNLYGLEDVYAGIPTTIQGSLNDENGVGIEGSTVHLQSRAVGSDGAWTTVKTLTSGDDGELTVAATFNSTVSVRFTVDAKGGFVASSSSPVTVTVGRVPLSLDTDIFDLGLVRVGRSVTVEGSLSSAVTNLTGSFPATVRFRPARTKTWSTVGSGVFVAKNGSVPVRFNYRVGEAGTLRLRYPGNAYIPSAVSRVLPVRVTPTVSNWPGGERWNRQGGTRVRRTVTVTPAYGRKVLLQRKACARCTWTTVKRVATPRAAAKASVTFSLLVPRAGTRAYRVWVLPAVVSDGRSTAAWWLR